MTPALKAAWPLTGFVVLAGIVGWIATGQVAFAVFVVGGVGTAVAAFGIGRASAPEEGTP